MKHINDFINENKTDVDKLVNLVKDSSSDSFKYQMLGRLKSDCEYFLGNGNRYSGSLYMKNVNDQIEAMEKIWNILKEKPEWLTLDQIKEFKNKMK